MASAQISETIRPAYVWTGTEWVQIGDGGSGTGGGGSVVGGTNIFVDYNEELNTYTVSASGGFTSVDSVQYPDYIVFDTTPENTSASVGTLAWDDGEEGLSVQVNENVNLTLGKEIYSLVYNGEDDTLEPGEVVMVNGAQGQRPRVVRAYNTNDARSARTFGMVAESIASGGEGIVITQGVIGNIDTDDYEAGDILYLSASPGLVTTVKPQAPNHYVWVGVVLKKNSSSGRIYIKPQNGYELDEIHDVRITSIAEGDIIVWNSASSLWLNEPIQDYLNTASAAAVDAAPAVFYQSASPASADIGDLWIDSDGDLGDALATSHIHGQYLASNTASATYLSINNASATYLTIVDASATYATQVDLDNIDLTSTINTASAAAYASASAYTDSEIAGIDLSPYLTASAASATYATQAELGTIDVDNLPDIFLMMGG